jgi:hypothetical protein
MAVVELLEGVVVISRVASTAHNDRSHCVPVIATLANGDHREETRTVIIRAFPFFEESFENRGFQRHTVVATQDPCKQLLQYETTVGYSAPKELSITKVLL